MQLALISLDWNYNKIKVTTLISDAIDFDFLISTQLIDVKGAKIFVDFSYMNTHCKLNVLNQSMKYIS